MLDSSTLNPSAQYKERQTYL